MRCKHCGVRVARSHFPLASSPKWVHVTDNGDRISAYCQLVLAEPAEEG